MCGLGKLGVDFSARFDFNRFDSAVSCLADYSWAGL
jgi:hypothetical protein